MNNKNMVLPVFKPIIDNYTRYLKSLKMKLSIIKNIGTEPTLELPKLFRYIVLYGGRCSGKTYFVVGYICARVQIESLRVVIFRKYNSDNKQSTYNEFVTYIENNTDNSKFRITRDAIYCKSLDGKESIIVFDGISKDILEIKGKSNFDICYIDEAEGVTEEAMNTLSPTIRAENSQIIMTFNPVNPESYIYKNFVLNFDYENSFVLQVNYDSNIFLTTTIIDEINYIKLKNPEMYDHIYRGLPMNLTEEVVFKECFSREDNKWEIKELEEVTISKDNRYIYNNNYIKTIYLGIDFGFVNPTGMIEVIRIDVSTLYVRKIYYAKKLLITGYSDIIIKTFEHSYKHTVISGDSANQDKIEHLKKMGNGINIEPCIKGKNNSVQDGIDYLKAHKIIIHPQCKELIFEFYNYKYQKDNITGHLIEGNPVKKHDHLIDALRYALHKEIIGYRIPTNNTNSIAKNFEAYKNRLNMYKSRKRH